MANKRIKDLSTTAAVTASDDFIAVDGATNGTRKLDAYSPTFGGNLTVSGALSSGSIAATSSSTTIGTFTSSGATTAFTLNNTNANGWGSNLVIQTGGTTAGYFGTLGSLLGTTSQDLVSWSTAGNGFKVYTNGNNLRLTIDSAGLTTLAGNLTVSGTGGISIGSATFTGGRALTATTGSGNNVSLRLLQTSVADWEVQNVATTGALAFSQSGSALSTLTATGNLLLGTTTDSGNGKLQLATHTTSAGGIGFGTDTSLYRISAGRVVIDHLGGSLPLLALRENGSSTLEIYTTSGVGVINTKTAKDLQFNTNNTLALTLDSSQRCILAGALRLNNAYTAGAPTATGYVTIQDSAGNTYKVLVGT